MNTLPVRIRRIAVADWLPAGAGAAWTLVDLCLAAGLAAVAVPLAVRAGRVDAVVLVLAQTLPLGWRRHAPAVVVTVTTLAGLGYALLVLPGLPVALTPALALYTLAATTRRRISVAGLVLSGAVTTVAIVIVGGPVTYVAMGWCALITAWAVGANTRTRRAYLAELRARADWLAADRERGIAAAASAERHRIARELHDVVTHNVTVMVIGAGAGRMATTAGPERLRAELATIEQTGRQTLNELRRLLGVLRVDDTTHPREPQPGLSRLDALVARTRAAGLPVDVTVHGRPRSLPQGIDVSAFRIVQEALSNTLRHAGPCTARVDVEYEPAAVRLSVRDTGRGPAARAGRDGHGLVGMRERVALTGGELRTGPAAGGGFEIVAWLPLTDTP